MGLALPILGVVALFLIVAEAAKKHAAAESAPIPIVTLPSTGTGGAGESASQQEEGGAIQSVTAIGTNLATGNIAGAATAAVTGLLTQLTQHSERLSDAKAESSAGPAAVQAFDADMAAIATAYSSGKATPQQVIQAITALNTNIYAYLHGLVGKPGTAWPASQPAGGAAALANGGVGITCNSKCTYGCCLFYDDMNPMMVTVVQAMSGGTPNMYYQAVPNGFILSVSKVYPPDNSAYGTFTRAAYTLSFVAPAKTPASLLASVI
jgi:hypothetical protein